MWQWHVILTDGQLDAAQVPIYSARIGHCARVGVHAGQSDVREADDADTSRAPRAAMMMTRIEYFATTVDGSMDEISIGGYQSC